MLPAYRRHRIIVPVYIPGRDGYFSDALEVFRMSLASLLATVDPALTSITILDNASIAEVEALVRPELDAGRIDRYVRSSVNRGKSDPVAAELRGSYEPFLSIADADVLFLPGWQQETERLFRAFPQAQAVSPSPAPNLIHYASSSTWLRAVPGLSLRLDNQVNGDDLDQFEASVGKSIFDSSCRRLQFMLAGRDGTRALLGAGHFVISFRRECFGGFRYEPTLEGTGHGDRIIDEHVDRCGGLRLATPRAWVRHMGNVPEDWMRRQLADILAQPRASEPEKRADDEDSGLKSSDGKIMDEALAWRPDALTRLLAGLPYGPRRRLAWLLRALAVYWRRWRLRGAQA